MGLDIYVGPFTRYCLGDWETIIQRTAREQGLAFKMIRTNPEPADKVTDPVVVHQGVDGWRRSLEAGLKAHLPSGLSWDERAEAPYFTDKPDWVGYACAVLLAAHTEHPGCRKPEKATADWDKDEAFKTSTSPGFKSRFYQLFDVEIWLPCDFPFTFKAQDVGGNEVLFGSSVLLLDQLKQLNAESYNGDAADLGKWKYDGAGREDSFDQGARFGLAMFLYHAEKSVQHRLPMKLDY
jgi:hypothetical protein